MAVIDMALRQPKVSIRTDAKGVITMGATPAPSETSDTASERCLSNQPTVLAMSGAKNAPPAMPTRPPYAIWKTTRSEVVLAR